MAWTTPACDLQHASMKPYNSPFTAQTPWQGDAYATDERPAAEKHPSREHTKVTVRRGSNGSGRAEYDACSVQIEAVTWGIPDPLL